MCSNCSEKPVKAKGLCSACYQRYRRGSVESAKLAHRAANKRYRLEHPNYRKSRQEIERRRRYGLSEEAFETLMEKAQGKCELCQSVKKLCIDHDHASGRVRGILCDRCNKSLGAYEYMLKLEPMLTAYLNKK